VCACTGSAGQRDHAADGRRHPRNGQAGRGGSGRSEPLCGPRAAWEPGAQILTPAGKNLGARHRGMEQLVYAVEDIKRACSLGIRSVLIADEGLLWVAAEMRKAGLLPADFRVQDLGTDGRC